ncbi:hypothetical protein Tsubulata_047954 [Turnera subulata]|uniref:Uncharacterized protein n=1 Tax=Turnera subulata TaxID=218843 RepID=A0A9Q0JJA3_9ROSI|nr:hypothetical protein Tsubulata_047954 [Turnera subulata]
MLMAIRSMHQDWMIHPLGPSRDVPLIHSRYMGPVHIKYVMCICTGLDQMVGSQRV